MWERVLDYAWYAVKHNWTPDQVDNLPDFFAGRLAGYHQMLDEIHNEQADRTERIRAARDRRRG